MSEYLRDSGHNDMRTCDSCGGAFYSSRGPSEEEEEWTCDTCKAKDDEIARLRAALKPFAEFARNAVGPAVRVVYSTDGAVRITNHDFHAALKALEDK